MAARGMPITTGYRLPHAVGNSMVAAGTGRAGQRPMEHVTLWFAILAVVLTGAALASGIIDRAPLSLPILFLLFGFVLRPGALGLTQLGPRDPALVAVATLNFALVLFLD